MANPFYISLLVGVGGAAGSLSRYGLSLGSQRLGAEWPLGTLAANILGCLFIGIIAGASGRGEAISPEMRLALATGFCGGFTTMSSMIYESAELLRAGEYLHATVYAVGSFGLSLMAFFAGLLVVRLLFRV